MKSKLTLLLLGLQISISTAQIIPSTRLSSWSESGYGDSIPEPTLILDVMSFGAVGDGITDDYAAVSAAIAALGGAQGVIYFPPGEYKIGTSLNLPDSVVLRGATSDSTHLKFDLQGAVGNCINITGSVSGPFDTIVAAYRGLNVISVLDGNPYQAGMYLELVEDNGSWDTQPVSWADNSVGQIVKLTNVTPSGVGAALETQSNIRADYGGFGWGTNARVRILTPAHEVGIECMRISRADSIHAGVCFNIYFNYAVHCWIRGVESSKSIGSHVEVDASSRITITGSYFHHAYEYDGVSTHGYGITLFNHTGECRVENNIMQHLRHSFSFQAGANGNVNAYNYSFDPNRSEAPADFGADISMHGHFPFSNLFEGNIVQNIQLDQTWGPSGPYNTFFRNRAELYGILMTSATVESNEQHFVGNEVTNTFPFQGNYIIAGTGHIEYGNTVRGVLTPSGTTPLGDSSYYLTAPPTFWGTAGNWPSIGIPNTPGTGTNPAKARYLAGGPYTVCREDVTTGIESPDGRIDENEMLRIYPNPANESVRLEYTHELNNKASVKVIDFKGHTVLEESLTSNDLNIRKLTQGIYVLQLFVNEKYISKVKMVIVR